MTAPATAPTGVLRVAGGAIDVHSHYLPAAYRAALAGAPPDGIPALPEWDPQAHLAGLDELGIATALLSISSPGVLRPTREATVALARSVNDDGAATVAAHPRRFGLLAALPLPHVDEAVAEVRRAFDELGADGVALMTNYGGRYVGDPAFAPVLAELDRRGAAVLVHPVSPPNHGSVSFGRPTPMLEFPFETTRAVADLVLSGATRRHPGIRWIVSHAGAALPVLAERISWVSRLLRTEGADVDVLAELGRLHYDLAGTPLPIQLPALIALVGTDRLLYGSDMTFTPVDEVVPLAATLRDAEQLAGVRDSAFRAHAEALFPRLAS